MENKIQVYPVNDKVQTLVILEGHAIQPEAPAVLNVTGHIGVVSEFMSKYENLLLKKGESIPNGTYITINNKKGIIVLMVNPFGTELDHKGTVCSTLKLSEELESLQINALYRDPKELGDFLRLNQHLLAETNTDKKGMIAALRNFKVNFTRIVDNDKDGRGNLSVRKEQIINSCNLPHKIDFVAPVFAGDEKFIIECDVEVDPDSLKIVLICPNLIPMIEERKEFLLQMEIEKITALPIGTRIPIMRI